MSFDNKSDKALKTIGEVSEEIDIPPYVLRFWEKKFNILSPVKRKNIRYYRPDDIKILETIKTLLYKKGFTIKGAKKFLKEHKKEEILDSNINNNKQDTYFKEEIFDLMEQSISDLKDIKNTLKTET